MTLLANEDGDFRFMGWGGDDCSGFGPAPLVMTEDRTCSASFKCIGELPPCVDS